jgi:hypothetical protein
VTSQGSLQGLRFIFSGISFHEPNLIKKAAAKSNPASSDRNWTIMIKKNTK